MATRNLVGLIGAVPHLVELVVPDRRITRALGRATDEVPAEDRPRHPGLYQANYSDVVSVQLHARPINQVRPGVRRVLRIGAASARA